MESSLSKLRKEIRKEIWLLMLTIFSINELWKLKEKSFFSKQKCLISPIQLFVIVAYDFSYATAHVRVLITTTQIC